MFVLSTELNKVIWPPKRDSSADVLSVIIIIVKQKSGEKKS